MKKNLCVFAILTLFAFVFVSCADGIKGSYSGGSSGSGGSYTSVSGGTYADSSNTFVVTFNEDKSVTFGGSLALASSSLSPKWKVSGTTVTVYDSSTSVTIYTFTANSTFTTLNYNGAILTRQ